MTWTAGLKRLTSTVGCLLLPLSVPAESGLSDGDQRTTAHLMFKIVIPQVLSVDLGQTLSVGGNQQKVFLLTPGEGGIVAEHRQIIMSLSGHHSIAQFAACSRTGASDHPAMSCTISMP